MTRSTNRWLVVLLLVLSLGTPWGFLQSVAWVSMLAEYSQHASLAQAIAMTFDGKHPCKLCHLVQKGQAEEKQQQKQSPQKDLKLELALPPAVFALIPVPHFRPEFHPAFNPGLRSYRPSVPPPRAS